ncbi:hypothetical protein TIFTF001_039187 [Ficus carica]|uniref:Uncharacterized protein n=1 Tax=Ficus carica TaxID=3494 RepID=A0AA88JAR9_FICCA|nr:hypothetical protein TIFTF001_039187 [Ficus carica]
MTCPILGVDSDFQMKFNFVSPFQTMYASLSTRHSSAYAEWDEGFFGINCIIGRMGVELSVDDVLAIYYPQENSKDHGRYSMYPKRKKQVVGEMKNVDRYWQDRYFFIHVNKKSMGDLANAFYPLWGTLRKELKKPPPKALLFEEKLESLLSLLNRE